VAGVGDLVQRTEDGRTGRVLDDRAIERSGSTVCDLHRAHRDEKHVFFGWASNQVWQFVSGFGFGFKTTQTVFSSLVLKSVVTVFFGLTSKLVGRVFGLDAKIGSTGLVI
jgi:hypothetical protein